MAEPHHHLPDSHSGHMAEKRIIEIARRGTPMSEDEKTHFDTCRACRSNITMHILGAQHAARSDQAHQEHKDLMTEDHLIDWWMHDLPKEKILEIDAILEHCVICHEMAEREGRALELLGDQLDWSRLGAP